MNKSKEMRRKGSTFSKFSQTFQHKKEPSAATCEAKLTKQREVVSNDDNDDFEETTRSKTRKEHVHRRRTKIPWKLMQIKQMIIMRWKTFTEGRI